MMIRISISFIGKRNQKSVAYKYEKLFLGSRPNCICIIDIWSLASAYKTTWNGVGEEWSNPLIVLFNLKTFEWCIVQFDMFEDELCAYTHFEVSVSRKLCITKNFFQGCSTLLTNDEQLSKFFMDESRCEKYQSCCLHCIAQRFPIKKLYFCIKYRQQMKSFDDGKYQNRAKPSKHKFTTNLKLSNTGQTPWII